MAEPEGAEAFPLATSTRTIPVGWSLTVLTRVGAEQPQPGGPLFGRVRRRPP